MNHLIQVEDMNCDRCRATIDAALSRIENVSSVRIDLREKRIEVTGEVDAAVLQHVIAELGYSPRLLSSSDGSSTPD